MTLFTITCALCLLIAWYYGARSRRHREEAARIELLCVPLEAGHCPVCSWDRWGKAHGFLDESDKSSPHACPEALGWSRERMQEAAAAIRKRGLKGG